MVPHSDVDSVVGPSNCTEKYFVVMGLEQQQLSQGEGGTKLRLCRHGKGPPSDGSSGGIHKQHKEEILEFHPPHLSQTHNIHRWYSNPWRLHGYACTLCISRSQLEIHA
ncbi:unnamed protein product, partial [Vitis vinifera]|uniref:Uncharacterized protein n=1 Tax=Vitis vinifera TaxID=29760 RepID=D7TGW2_VITVI